ncbi:MAG: hypothetical protein LBU81_05780 [Methanosarcinales archaeon]|nr:hypothetical protein [Methanosarcinales archaeon]
MNKFHTHSVPPVFNICVITAVLSFFRSRKSGSKQTARDHNNPRVGKGQ